MSQFIDYKKRSVTLPPGCKDLIDVLRLAEKPQLHGSISAGDRPGGMRGGSVKGKLSEIGWYVARVFESKAAIIFLMMTAPDERFTIELVRGRGALRAFSVKFVYDLDRETAVRAFFERRCLRLPKKTAIPGHFSPHLPVQFMFAVSPLPSEPAAISALATELLRDVCRLDDKAEIVFRYYESTRDI